MGQRVRAKINMALNDTWDDEKHIVDKPMHMTRAHDLTRIDCGNPKLTDWLHQHARGSHATRISRRLP